MIKLTEFESEVLKVIEKWQRLYTNSPTIPELTQELKSSPERVRYAVESLTEKGYLEMVYPLDGHRMVIVVLFWE